MPIIKLPYKYLETLTGTDRDTIIDRVPMIGADIERIEEDHIDVEFFPDRPDLFSTEGGVARAMQGFLGLKDGINDYPITPPPASASGLTPPASLRSGPSSGLRSSATSR